MTTVRQDIAELRRLLDAGEDEVKLNDQALEVHERIRQEWLRVSMYISAKQQELIEDRCDFESVLDEIRKRRRIGVLSAYEAHRKKLPID